MVFKVNKKIQLLLIVLASCLIGTTVLAAKSTSKKRMYRYVNDEGVTVTSSTLPPKYSQNGYDIVTELGILIEKVPPRKTDEQLRQEALEAEKKAEEERLRREQEKLDSILLNSYTDISDIERARDNELDSKDRDVMLLKQNIRRYTRLLEDAQTRAARDERLGKALSPSLMKEINQFKRHIANKQGLVDNTEEDKEIIRDRYNSSIIRFSELKAAERLKQFRASKDEDKKAHTIYDCRGVDACDDAWSASLRFASEYSTTELAWANESTIMMRKPRKNDDISIVLTRVDNSYGDAASIVLEIRCNKSPKGEQFCASEEVNSVRSGFTSYLQADPTKRP